MSGYLLRLVDVQTIADFTFELPKEGIVKFSGGNNDGKSIARKVLFDMIGCQFHIKDNRWCLINDDKDFAKCIFTNLENGSEIEAFIHREQSQTYYELRLKDKEPIRRYIKDKGLKELMDVFGFHYLEKRDFSLNVHPANSPILFETTTGICNREAYDSATEDPKLNTAIENVENVISELKEHITEEETAKKIAEAKINRSLEIDEKAEIAIIDKLRRLRNNIDAIIPIDIIELKKPYEPNSFIFEDLSILRDSLLSLKKENKRVRHLYKNIEILSSIEPVDSIYNNIIDYKAKLESFKDETCPTCGGSLLDGHCEI